MQINIAAFKAGWRQACAARGIDPAAGPNTYQMLGYKAEVEIAKKRRLAAERHWATEEGLARLKNWGLDSTSPPPPLHTWRGENTDDGLADWGVYRSSVEKEALAHVRAEAKLLREPIPAQDMPTDSWVRLTLEETLQALQEDDEFEQAAPLRDIHARKQVKLEWINLYDGRPLAISVLVPVRAE